MSLNGVVRLSSGRMSDSDKRALEASITYWHDCTYAMEVMLADAPNHVDADIMRKMIGHLRQRMTAMSVGLTKH